MTGAWARGLVALAAAVVCLVASVAPATATPAAPPDPYPHIREGTEGAKITSFFFGKNDQITPLPPYNETSGQTTNALGVSFPRALVSNVGTWSVTLVEEGMTVDSVDGLSIWASSDQGASNVRFTISVQVNGNEVGRLATERKAALSSTPEEFRIDPGGSQVQAQSFQKGVRVSFQLQYSAGSSHGPIGPSSDSTFHYYHNLYRSRVDFVTNPFNLTLDSVKMDSTRINATTIVKDAFGVDMAEKTYSLSFDGPTNSQPHHVKVVNTLVDPVNGTQLIWNWNFVEQGQVTSGAYTVTLAARYEGSEINYSNVSTMEIQFPRGRSQDKGLLPGAGALEAAGALGATALLVAVASARRAWARREEEEPARSPKL